VDKDYMNDMSYFKKSKLNLMPKGLFITLIIVFVSFLTPSTLKAQFCSTNGNEKDVLLLGVVVEGDTFAIVHLDAVTVEAEMKFASRKKKEEWDRLKYNVKKAYPYAIIAAGRLREYENNLKKLPNEASRKAYMKIAEDKLKKEFEEQLKQLTIKQGKILIKLIDRETGRTSYQLVKQLRGTFSAWMWQGLAKLFGSDLKSEYDAKGEDRMIEVAIAQIENGSF
jgi:hypothetical protein